MVNPIQVADGILFLKDGIEITPEIIEKYKDFKIFSSVTYDADGNISVGSQTYPETSKDLWEKSSKVNNATFFEKIIPAHIINPNGYKNELQNNPDNVLQEIENQRLRKPDFTFVYTPYTIQNDELPPMAQKLGLEFERSQRFEFVTWNGPENGDYDNCIAYQDENGNPSNVTGANVKDNKITVFDKVYAFNNNDLTELKNIDQQIEAAQQNCATEDEKEQAKRRVLAGLSNKFANLYNIYGQTKNTRNSVLLSLTHELQHVKNSILLDGRRIKPTSKRISAQDYYQLAAHDEKSASLSELLTAVKIYQKGKNPNDFSMFNVDSDWLKEELKNLPSDQRMAHLNDIGKLVQKSCQQWNAKKIGLYTAQFEKEMELFGAQYPTSKVGKHFDNNSEYLRQRSLLYKFKVYNPATQKEEEMDLSQFTEDLTLDANQKNIIKDAENQIRKRAKDLANQGVGKEEIQAIQLLNHRQHIKQAKGAQRTSGVRADRDSKKDKDDYLNNNPDFKKYIDDNNLSTKYYDKKFNIDDFVIDFMEYRKNPTGYKPFSVNGFDDDNNDNNNGNNNGGNDNGGNNNPPEPPAHIADDYKDEIKNWKKWCQDKNYTYSPDNNCQDGLRFDIYRKPEDKENNQEPLASLKYEKDKVSVNSKAYEVFDEIVRQAKDKKYDVITFSPDLKPEKQALLLAACLKYNMPFENAPKQVDLQSESAQSIPQDLRDRLETYNQQQNRSHQGSNKFEDYKKQFEEAKAKGVTSVDLKQIPKEEVLASFAAAKLAGMKIENAAPYFDFSKTPKEENGNKTWEETTMSKAFAELPKEAQNAVVEHNIEARKEKLKEINKKRQELAAKGKDSITLDDGSKLTMEQERNNTLKARKTVKDKNAPQPEKDKAIQDLKLRGKLLEKFKQSR